MEKLMSEFDSKYSLKNDDNGSAQGTLEFIHVLILFFFVIEQASSMAVGDEDAAKNPNENVDNEDEDLYDRQLYLELYCTIFGFIMYYICKYNLLNLEI